MCVRLYHTQPNRDFFGQQRLLKKSVAVFFFSSVQLCFWYCLCLLFTFSQAYATVTISYVPFFSSSFLLPFEWMMVKLCAKLYIKIFLCVYMCFEHRKTDSKTLCNNNACRDKIDKQIQHRAKTLPIRTMWKYARRTTTQYQSIE